MAATEGASDNNSFVNFFSFNSLLGNWNRIWLKGGILFIITQVSCLCVTVIAVVSVVVYKLVRTKEIKLERIIE